MNGLTIDDIMNLRPCARYTRARVAELWGGRESLTPLEILDLPIPAADRVWVMCQRGVLPASTRKVAVTAIADRAVRNNALPCPATARWAARWLSGEDRSAVAAWEASVVAARAAAVAAAMWADAVADAVADADAAAAREGELQVRDFRAAIHAEVSA